MIYIFGLVLMANLYLKQKAAVLWPVSAGAPEPEFTEYSRAFHAMIAFEKRLFPLANRIALVGLLGIATVARFDYAAATDVLFALVCLSYIGLNYLPQYCPYALRDSKLLERIVG